MNLIFFEITVVLVLATALGIAARALRQPTIIGYIATGIIVGPLGLLHLNNPDVIDALAQFGIAFLLFLVGMEMNFSELRHVGRSAVLIGVGQVLFTSVVGFGLATALGFALLPAAYIGITLTFSSTIIVIKLLSEKKALESLYGKLVVGVLLVQDFVALGVLIVLSGISGPEFDPSRLPAALVAAFAKGTMLLVFSLLAGKYVMPKLLHRLSGSQEVLFLASLAWGLGLAALASLPSVGLTIEIGAFMAGVSLSESIEHFQIMSRVKALRDFFAVMFFIVLGSKLVLSGVGALWLPTVVLSLFVLIGNPVIVMLIMGSLGYRSRTSFMTGVTVAQISEFSLIVVTLGHRLGHIGDGVVSLVTAVGLITIAVSSYLILHSEAVYEKLAPILKIFEFGAATEKREIGKTLKGHIVLIGCHRMGHNILHSLESLHKRFLVVDFNPDMVAKLHRRGLHAIYGDITDPDIQNLAQLDTARVIVSTIPSVQDSIMLLARVKAGNPGARLIVTAETEDEALTLYERGADYVLLPHFVGGLQIARLLEEDKTLKSLEKLRDQDLTLMLHS